MKNINELMNEIKKKDFNTIAPNYNKKIINEEEIDKILDIVANDINGSTGEALVGIILLMLKGSASSGTPINMTVDLPGGKTLSKKTLLSAYVNVTKNNHIRRLAEALAINIGEFAEHFKLNGELAQRINTILKAETGETLTSKEMAWCSSFSQNVPDLAKRSSERLVRLLADDYRKRFENKKKPNKEDKTIKGKSK